MLLLALLFACHDNTLTVHNADPVVSISDPFGGATLPAEVPITLVVLASDDITPLEELQVQWASDLDGLLPGSVEFADGQASTVIGEGISAGDHMLTVTVFDEKGSSATDSVMVLAVPNEPPSVEILSPAEGDTFVAASPLQVVAFLADDFDAPDALSLGLTSSVSGTVPFTSALSGGTVTLDVSAGLTDEDQTLTLQVYDTGGQCTEASVGLRTARNSPPEVTLSSPVEGEVYEQPSLWVELTIEDPDTVDYSLHELIWTGLVDSPWVTITSHLPFHPSPDGTVGTWLEFTCEPTGSDQEPNPFVIGVTVTDPGAARGADEAQILLRCQVE
jgi:hypothetical protein